VAFDCRNDGGLSALIAISCGRLSMPLSSETNARKENRRQLPIGRAAAIFVLGLGMVITIVWAVALGWVFCHLLNVL
jgi:hypothetical protein